MAPSIYTRCVDILYMLNGPAFRAKLLRCIDEVAISCIIFGLRYFPRPIQHVCAMVWAVADFMWAPYQFLVQNDELTPWPTAPGAIYVAEIFPIPYPLAAQFVIICDVVTIELTCIITHVAGLAAMLCLLSLTVC